MSHHRGVVNWRGVAHSGMAWFTKPQLSVVVVVHDMAREAPRTIHSLTSGYQDGLDENAYEVLVMDNGSDPDTAEMVRSACGPNMAYHRVVDAGPSPVPAINEGIARSRGQHVGLFIDGARMASPGLLRMALMGLSLHARAIVSTLAWHLGPKPQMESVAEGYDAATEDALLASIGWPSDGYDLFTVSSLAGSSSGGFFLPMAESNALFMPRQLIDELGGFDVAFTRPGGGIANLDLYERACALADTTLVTLLGEGTFHQVHGGVATNVPEGSAYVKQAFADYRALRGRDFQRPRRKAVYLGTLPGQVLPFMAASVEARVQFGADPTDAGPDL